MSGSRLSRLSRLKQAQAGKSIGLLKPSGRDAEEGYH